MDPRIIKVIDLIKYILLNIKKYEITKYVFCISLAGGAFFLYSFLSVLGKLNLFFPSLQSLSGLVSIFIFMSIVVVVFFAVMLFPVFIVECSPNAMIDEEVQHNRRSFHIFFLILSSLVMIVLVLFFSLFNFPFFYFNLFLIFWIAFFGPLFISFKSFAHLIVNIFCSFRSCLASCSFSDMKKFAMSWLQDIFISVIILLSSFPVLLFSIIWLQNNTLIKHLDSGKQFSTIGTFLIFLFFLIVANLPSFFASIVLLIKIPDKINKYLISVFVSFLSFVVIIVLAPSFWLMIVFSTAQISGIFENESHYYSLSKDYPISADTDSEWKPYIRPYNDEYVVIRAIPIYQFGNNYILCPMNTNVRSDLSMEVIRNKVKSCIPVSNGDVKRLADNFAKSDAERYVDSFYPKQVKYLFMLKKIRLIKFPPTNNLNS